METDPTKLNPNLHIEEINMLGTIIYTARMNCRVFFDEENGDTSWSYGCRARDWTRAAFRKAVKSGKYPFLTIPIDKRQSFVLALNGVPISFFYDDVKSPSSRVLKSSLPEQLSLFLNTGMENLYEIRWRIIIQKDPSLEVVGMVFMGLDIADQIVCGYDIPLQNNGQKLYEITNVQEEAVDLAEPEIFEKIVQKEREKRNGT